MAGDTLQRSSARGYRDQEPLERSGRDVRLFAICGGTALMLRAQVASRILGIETPQTREGCTERARPTPPARVAA